MLKTINSLASLKDKDGKYIRYTSVGCYTIIYLLADGEVCCPDCINAGVVREDHDDKELRLIDGDVYWEGPVLECACCGNKIESSYGDPDEGKEQSED